MSLEIELHVKEVFESQNTAGAFSLLLEEKSGENRQIPIIIGDKEAHAIFCSLKNISNSRPLTHDLMASCINFLEAKLTKVLIYKVNEGIYYSYIYLNKDDQFTRIDARTSDAVALALRLEAPIYILSDILDAENVEVVMESEDDFLSNPIFKVKEKVTIESLQRELELAIQEEDYELASVIRDQIAEIEAKK